MRGRVIRAARPGGIRRRGRSVGAARRLLHVAAAWRGDAVRVPHVHAEPERVQGAQDEADLRGVLPVLRLGDPGAGRADPLRQLGLRPADGLAAVPNQCAERPCVADSHGSLRRGVLPPNGGTRSERSRTAAERQSMPFGNESSAITAVAERQRLLSRCNLCRYLPYSKSRQLSTNHRCSHSGAKSASIRPVIRVES